MLFLINIALLTVIMSGCVESAKAYTEPDKTIDVGLNNEYVIALGSNISTGYSWQLSYDEEVLTLVEKTYEDKDNTGKQIVGADGTEYFTFKTLSKGETKVTFTYKRPWEQPSAQDQTLVFTIDVK
jgi:inhibitor of cysteine peptidase